MGGPATPRCLRRSQPPPSPSSSAKPPTATPLASIAAKRASDRLDTLVAVLAPSLGPRDGGQAQAGPPAT